MSRFDLNERLVHWTTALLLLTLIVTGTILYIPSLMLKVGNRATVVNIHVITGLALVGPVFFGLLGPWRSRLAKDFQRLDRWKRNDFAYFRRGDRTAVANGKFNAGQKLSAAIFGGGMLVMIGTGIVMRWSPPFPNWWAQGATLAHDTIYLVLTVLVLGHVVMALSRPEQLKSMFTGQISRAWAERNAPGWLDGTDISGRPGRGRAPAETRPRPSARRDEAVPAGKSPASG
ncbi:MAG: cytochrome b/b6 domain-containing protein [Acidimicrobiales bacterium]